MADGVGGVLIESVEECAEAILYLLKDPHHAMDLAARGRERVREHFLLPRLLLNEVALMEELALERPTRREPVIARRDPVCGMAVSEAPPDLSVVLNSRTYVFCSESCRSLFSENPERFIGKSSATR